MEVELKNQETEEEPATKKIEKRLQVQCHIDNNNNPIDQLTEGMRISMTGQVEKHSPVLGRDAVYSKTEKINRLPSYLTINYVRFYYKQASSSAGTEAGKAKILKSVGYSRTLDVYEFCSDELKKSLDQGREHDEKLREEDDIRRHGKTKQQKEAEAKEALEKGGDPKADVEMAEAKEETHETVFEYKDKNGKKLVGAAAKAA